MPQHNQSSGQEHAHDHSGQENEQWSPGRSMLPPPLQLSSGDESNGDAGGNDANGQTDFDTELEGLKSSDLSKKDANPGTNNQQEMVALFVKDLQNMKEKWGTENVTEDWVAWLTRRMTSLFLYLTHNASSRPIPTDEKTGGQVSEVEFAKPLWYYRSQSKGTHPHEKFYRNILHYLKDQEGLDMGSEAVGGQTYPHDFNSLILPIRETAMDAARLAHPNSDGTNPVDKSQMSEVRSHAADAKLHKGTEDEKTVGKTQHSDHTYSTSKGGHFNSQFSGPKAARYGLRQTNSAVYREAIEMLIASGGDTFGQTINLIIDFVKRHFFGATAGKLPSTPSQMERANQDLNAYIDQLDAQLNAQAEEGTTQLEQLQQDGGEAFEQMSSPEEQEEIRELAYAENTGTDTSLDEEGIDYRRTFGNALAESMAGAGFSYVNVFTDEKNPNLQIQPTKPRFANAAYSYSEPYHQVGYVGLVMSFLGGLLNSKGRAMGVVANRRQSFGFMRPSLTDTAESIRFSLGTQPLEYSQVVLASMVELDQKMGGASEEQVKYAFKVINEGQGQTRLTKFFTAEANQQNS